ncbi:MAG: kelch repeat-containing protein, partial [Candidatus Lutacidiplasmatales archaeon]
MRGAWRRPSTHPRLETLRLFAVGAIASLFVVPVALSFGERPEPAAASHVAADSFGWSRVPPPAFPQPYGRANAAVGFDPLAGAGVLFGGQGSNGTVLGDTWANDGDFPGRWSNETDTALNPPPPLTEASVAYDAASGNFVLFGGRLANGTLSGVTWELVGFHTWIQLPSGGGGSPPAQAGAGMVYDPAAGAIVLVSSSNASAATWTFRDGTWSPDWPSGGPTARSFPTVAYDPVDRAVFLFGGTGANGSLNDTWEYSGRTWTQVGSGPAPPASATPRVAYDPRGGGMLLFVGGAAATTW